MKELIAFLNKNRNGALATIENGKPRVRGWQFQFEEDGKFYFCTNNKKDVYGQLMKNPALEFASYTPAMETGRISGDAVFTKDNLIKQKVLDKNPILKQFYPSGNHPAFEVFFLEHGRGELSDISGKQPKRFSF
jgi:uncharacterized pyridoxamine 5'-phosphate oxidase family protein